MGDHGVTGIVLAGGRSARFGRDKLTETLDGRPLLQHAIEALISLCDEILVIAAPLDRRPAPQIPPDPRIRVVFDRQPFGGPLVGLTRGLEAAAGEIGLAVGGDMPALRPPLLGQMIERVVASSHLAVVLRVGGGLSPLPLAVRIPALRSLVADRLELGDRSLRGLLSTLEGSDRLDWLDVSADEPSLRDVDRVEDLDPSTHASSVWSGRGAPV